MGTFLAKLPKTADIPPHIKPGSGEMPWIIYHAAACGMSPVEVHRLWSRFKQLGSTTDGTVIAKGAKINEYFAVKILQSLADTKGEVQFKTFLGAALWWSRTDLEDKLGVVFYLMNENYPINQAKWKEILQKLHSDWDEYKAEELANLLLEKMDYNHDGQIDFYEFKTWHMAHVEPTARLLDFGILPPEVKIMDDELPISRMLTEHDMLHKIQAEIAKSMMASPRQSGTGSVGGGGGGGVSASGVSVSQSIVPPPPLKGEPCGDHILRAAAERLVGRDWMMLANNLNFTVADVDAIASLYAPGQDLQKVLTILKTWRDRDRGFATIDALENAMVLSGMRDVAADLRASLA